MKREMTTQGMTKTRIAACLLSMLLLALTACGRQTMPETPAAEVEEAAGAGLEAEDVEAAESVAENAETPAALPVTDPSGASVVIPEQVDSVVALAPSICETLVALDMADKITGYDLQSVGIAGLPENVPTFDTVNPDVEQLTALAPDILFVSNLSLYDQEAPYQPLIDAGVCVICVPTSESVEGVRRWWRRWMRSLHGCPISFPIFRRKRKKASILKFHRRPIYTAAEAVLICMN